MSSIDLASQCLFVNPNDCYLVLADSVDAIPEPDQPGARQIICNLVFDVRLTTWVSGWNPSVSRLATLSALILHPCDVSVRSFFGSMLISEVRSQVFQLQNEVNSAKQAPERLASSTKQ